MTYLAIFGGMAAAFLLLRLVPPRGAGGRWRYAVFLVLAALIYVAFALPSGYPWIIIELAGVVLYGGLAWCGVRRGAAWLAVGWGLHVLWDLALHPGGHPGFVPAWYPPACLGFDLVLAAALALAIPKLGTAGGPEPRIQ